MSVTVIPVVAAVIRTFDNRYLIGKRAVGMWQSGKWCFVGGKVKPGEQLQDAVFREVAEEIRVPVAVFELIHEQLVLYEHGLFRLHFFDCVIDSRYEPKPNVAEISEVKIVQASELADYDLLPVDIDVAKRIKLEAYCQKKDELLKRRQQYILDLEKTCSKLQEEVYRLTVRGETT